MPLMLISTTIFVRTALARCVKRQ